MKRNGILVLAVLCVVAGIYSGKGGVVACVSLSTGVIEANIQQESTVELLLINKIKLAYEQIYVTAETKPTVVKKPTYTEKKLTYSQEDLELLARVINAEAGSDWCSDEMQLLVGNVVLNRVADPRFPDTIEEVVFQKGQYACVVNGHLWKELNERAMKNAKLLMEGNRYCPENIVWQSEFQQGKGLWKQVGNQYFCY